ncbi:MAG TPA: DNA (cytosine-5-)-methyltransferase, partial [Terracidiphilus sp.]|nr:DNA (cytosine-5-)-methyltransferase [Terracidiphilus sp.]
MKKLSVLELCAGAGGQALGFEQAGFSHLALVELDSHACRTLRFNRPDWNVLQENLNCFDAKPFRGMVDVVAAGLPCPPFSKAGKQMGELDERNLFPAALRIIREVQPRAVIIENVRGILDAVFEDYRTFIAGQLSDYWTDWQLLNARDFGVPQLRPRVNFVAIRKGLDHHFQWPVGAVKAPTVG